jgi:hypothetical protein
MRTDILTVDFKFRPVGQGLFYTGVFKHRNENQFSIVYDCGTDSTRTYIDEEIDSFIKELNPIKNVEAKLDVLFISHFHADHTNKIASLLQKTKGAKYAILPYLNPDELFLAYTDLVYSGNYLDTNGNPDQNLLLLFSDPKSFFREFGVERIIFIHPDNDKNESNEPENPNKNDDYSSDDFQFELINNLKRNTDQPEEDKNVEHYFDSGSLTLNVFWEFKLFNKPRSTIAIKAFKKEIGLLINNQPTQSNLSDYIKSNPKTFQKSFQDIYENHFGVKHLINQTSTVVYHGAKDQKRWLGCYIPWHFFNFSRYIFSKYSGTLLTADICLDDKTLGEIKSKWIRDKYFDNVVLFQVPHHGSENDMTSQVFKLYNNVDLWLVNFGLGNKHKLPHQKIINKLVNNGKIESVFSNTQIKGFEYCFKYS